MLSADTGRPSQQGVRSPEVVPAYETLQTAPKDRVPEVLTELYGLISRTVSVPEVRSLWGTQMEAQALLRTTPCASSKGPAVSVGASLGDGYGGDTYKPIAFA